MKALIPAAGLGTRFLPATKAQPKEMLLVVDRPAIQYVVEEGLASAADEVVIINSREKKAIEEHFSPNPELVATLRARGKDQYADLVEKVGAYNVSYVYQDEALGLGHAVRCAAENTPAANSSESPGRNGKNTSPVSTNTMRNSGEYTHTGPSAMIQPAMAPRGSLSRSTKKLMMSMYALQCHRLSNHQSGQPARRAVVPEFAPSCGRACFGT